MAISKVKLPLKNVAKTIRNVASKLAPRNTGNLRNVLRSYNTPERMVKYDNKGEAKIMFYFGPPGAIYGRFWNKPPATAKSRVKNRPEFDFANRAYKDPAVAAAVKSYTKALGKQIVLDLKAELRNIDRQK